MVPNAELEKQIVRLHQELAEKNEMLQRQGNQMRELRDQFQDISTRISGSTGNLAANQQPRETPRQPVQDNTRLVTREQTVTQTPQPRETPNPVQPNAADQGNTGANTSQPRYMNYTVVAGDTLYSLRRRYGTDESAILRANPGLTAKTLKIGQTIVIPVQ